MNFEVVDSVVSVDPCWSCPLILLGLIFLVFSWNKKGNVAKPKAGVLRPLGIGIHDWLFAIGGTVSALYVPWVFHDPQFRVGNP